MNSFWDFLVLISKYNLTFQIQSVSTHVLLFERYWVEIINSGSCSVSEGPLLKYMKTILIRQLNWYRSEQNLIPKASKKSNAKLGLRNLHQLDNELYWHS